MTRFLLICLGGAAGSGARYLVSLWLPGAAGTLLVNVAGSFLIALVMQTMAPSDARLLLTAGVMGGFTTYSAFNQQTLESIRDGAWGTAAAIVVATLIGCLLAGAAGMWVGRLLTERG